MMPTPHRRTLLLGMAATALAAATAQAAPAPALTQVFGSDLVINGVATTPDGRMFLPVQPPAPGASAQVVEVRDGHPVAWPDARWNGWRPGLDGADRFVGVNALRIGPDGALWVVDRGGPGIGKPLAPHGVKLLRFDLATNSLARSYDLGAVTLPWSFVDDVRFNGRHAYLTDAGDPGLIVLDLETGQGRRVLQGHPSTVAQTPLVAEGRPLRDAKGDPVVIHADQLEISPDGRWFYYQPSNGRLALIETRFLDDAGLSDAELGRHVERFADTPSTGGTAIDADGTIYASDTDRSRILRISSSGAISTLIADPRLVWVDAMWIDDHGNLLLPASQLNRTAGLHDGHSAVRLPIVLYSLALGVKGVRR